MKKLFLYFLILAFLPGCSSVGVKILAEQTAFSQLGQLFKDEKVTDARFQHVSGYDFFQITLPLRYRIKKYDQLDGLRPRQDFISEFINQAADAGERAVTLELARLSNERIIAFLKSHPQLAGEAGDRDALMDSYRQHRLSAVELEQKKIYALASEADLDRYWSGFVAGIEESIMTKDRLKRQLKAFYAEPFIKLWIAYHEATDYRGPVKADFVDAEIYSPLITDQEHVGVSAADWTLLQKFSPVIVQEINEDGSYATNDDRIGAVSLQGDNLDDAMPYNDTDKPTVYAYVSDKIIQRNNVRQLIYTFFHPQHPKLSKFDPEAGIFDGWTVRISLDQNNQPLVYESVSNCGCYYKIFPARKLETLAQQSYANKLKDKQFFVENIVKGKYDAVVPELVNDNHNVGSDSVFLYYSAGRHQLATIRTTQETKLPARGITEKTYTLRPYDDLENLPFNGHRASLFATDGLVRKAHRPECKLLASSGVYHAGHPRQRETQMVYFDEEKFDDPGLLETYLRLPANAFGSH